MERIVFFLPSLKTGGGNRVMIELANVLAARNANVEIVSIANSSESNTFLMHEKIKLKKIGSYKDGMTDKLLNLFKAIYFIRTKRNDCIVVYTDPITSLFSGFLGSYKRYRFIQADDYAIYDDGQVLKSKLLVALYKFLCRFVYKTVTVNYIFNSRYTYDCFMKISGKKQTPFQLVYPALNHELFYNKQLRTPEFFSIALVGRKHPWKGLSDFIKAWNTLDEKVKTKVNSIYIVSHDDLSAFSFDSKFKIVKPSNDSEIAECFSKANVFISPSWWEGFGLPPLEAMACGAAIIVSRSGGVNEYCVENKNCLMFNPKDIDDLKTRLTSLLQNEGLQQQLAHAGMTTAQNFTWEKSADMLLNILNIQSENLQSDSQSLS